VSWRGKNEVVLNLYSIDLVWCKPILKLFSSLYYFKFWLLLIRFCTFCRYCLYSRWKNETHLLHAKLLRRRGETLKKIKGIMKRVTKETIKPMGRHIGKLTHSAPGILFDYVSLRSCLSLVIALFIVIVCDLNENKSQLLTLASKIFIMH
jgi:hypothetical protein